MEDHVIKVDGEAVYRELQDMLGTMPFSFKVGALGNLDTHYANGDWDAILEMALDFGVDLDQFIVE